MKMKLLRETGFFSKAVGLYICNISTTPPVTVNTWQVSPQGLKSTDKSNNDFNQ